MPAPLDERDVCLWAGGAVAVVWCFVIIVGGTSAEGRGLRPVDGVAALFYSCVILVGRRGSGCAPYILIFLASFIWFHSTIAMVYPGTSWPAVPHHPEACGMGQLIVGCAYALAIGLGVGSWRVLGLMVPFACVAALCPILLERFGWFSVAIGAAVLHAGILCSLRYSVLYVPVPVKRPLVKPGVCAACGYDLTGNATGRCPECGVVVAAVSGDGV